MAEKQFGYSTTKLVPAIWAHFLTPKGFKDPKTGVMGPEKYSGHFSFPEGHPDIKGIKERALEAFRAKYDVPLEGVRWPWTTGVKIADKRKAKGKQAEFFREFPFVLIAKSKYIRLGVRKDGKTVELRTDADRKAHETWFYSGVLVAAEFAFKPYFNDATEQYGVTCYVNMVESHNKGKRYGEKDMGDAFANVTGHETDDDPSGADEMGDY